MPNVQLPTYYYHDHFLEMLDFVGDVCASCLTDESLSLIDRLRQLSMDERCLYIRLANRKGYIFDTRQLVYPEIEDIDTARHGLMQKGFIRDLDDTDTLGFLNGLAKDQLADLCREAELTMVKPSWAKAKIISHALPHFMDTPLSNYWPVQHYIVRAEVEALDYLLFLYFGRNQESLKAFALRDLGIVRAGSRASAQSCFADAAEATYCFACTRIRALVDAGQLQDARLRLFALGDAPTDYAADCLARTACKLGQAFERARDTEDAIAIYRLSNGADCRERLIRLIYASGGRDEAKHLLEQIIDDPASDAEYIFATDFYRRKFKGERIGALTSLLRQSAILYLDDAHRDCPEYGVIAQYKADGWQAFFTENQLWHELFGLLFWDELFGRHAIADNGFDRLPFSITKGTFWDTHHTNLTNKLDKIRSGKALTMALQTVSAAWEQPNSIFAWQYLDIEALTAFLKSAPHAAVATLMEGMARNFMSYRDGFPDLMLVKDNVLKFVEVKAEGDVVRRNQLNRMQQLRAAGIDAEICRVQYRYDPQQIYVVVDIETTGKARNTAKSRKLAR